MEKLISVLCFLTKPLRIVTGLRSPLDLWHHLKQHSNQTLPFMSTSFCRVMIITLALLSGQVMSATAGTETELLHLSGHGKDDAVPWRFMCTSGAQSGYWTNLVVPSQWEMHGFGTLHYRKDPPVAWNEKGLYQHDFVVPADWSKRRVFLVFDGVMTDTSAKLNGESVGPIHQGGYYRFQYEVTKLVKFGETNHLEVTVAKHSANESVNRAERDADYWVFGGIYRPVYLEAVPWQFIKRVAIDAQADGAFTMDVFADGIPQNEEGMTVAAQITDLSGRPAGPIFSAPVSTSDGHAEVILKTKIASPSDWSAETPNLYRVQVWLKRGNELLHHIQQQFGFRTIEIRAGDGIYVNGHRVILKGVCRHCFWPDSGRCLSEAIQLLDVNTIKAANMNAVRTVHYPPDASFLKLCDEKGLYVLDELAGWHHYYDNTVGPKLVKEMVTRDVNHPSILFWDNGNEGGFNTNLDHLFDQYDPQHRRVLHPWATFDGFCTAHYLSYDQAKLACEGISLYYHKGHEIVVSNSPTKYIYMPTEFQHSLFDGGGGAGLADFWKLMSASPHIGGGFIWALLDNAVKHPDTGQMDTAGNQAPDGILGPYRQREASFYAIKEIWSPIVVTRRSVNTFQIENHYSFLNANQCRFIWQLRQFPQPGQNTSDFVVIRQGVAEPPSIPPGGKGMLQLDLPRINELVDALSLKVEDPYGRRLWTWVWPTRNVDHFRSLLQAPAESRVESTETANAIELKAGDLTIDISKQTGLLADVQCGLQHFSLADGPRPMPGNARLVKLTQKQAGSDYVVTAGYAGSLKSVTWRLQANGWLKCSYTYTATGPHEYYGVAFDYPENLVKSKRWLGDGPYRVWKNRRQGVTLNVWDNDYNNTITGWRDWIYPEFKGCFADVRWLQLSTKEGTITAIPENVPYVQMLMPEFPPANLAGDTDPPVPHAGLAFLNAIPPMGSKFKPASQMGPSGQLSVATGKYSGSVSFYFGKLPQTN
jgi:Glycosyl hydrolases family 2, TIM barrel domain/Glycosyl hydrolases family 2, sugar binding domain/Glycosyl hydrolases family 2